MRSLCIMSTLTIILLASCSSKKTEQQGSKVTVDNEKVKVTEFIGLPNGDVCGVGVHSHGPHLSILLSDAKVEITRDGKKETQDVFKGLSFWSEKAETHSVVNIGKDAVRSLIVEVK